MSALQRRDGGVATLRAVLVVLVAGSLVVGAGCSALPGVGDGGPPAGPALDTVPADVDAVAYVDVNGAVNDENLRAIADTFLSLQEDGPDDVDEAIEEAENESSLDISELQSMTVYGKATDGGPTESYVGIVVAAGWSESEIVAATEEEGDVTLEETTYAGKTLYVPQDAESMDSQSYFGVLGENQYVAGSEQAVKDALDVSAGNAAALSGDVRTAFENTRSDAYVRFAASVPQNEFDSGDVGGDQFNTDVFNDVTVVSGSHYTEGEDVALSLTMTFASESSAGEATDVVEGAVSLYRGLVEDEQAKQLLSDENLTVEQDGADVTITSSNDVETINAVIETVYGSSVGTPASLAAPAAPTRSGA